MVLSLSSGRGMLWLAQRLLTSRKRTFGRSRISVNRSLNDGLRTILFVPGRSEVDAPERLGDGFEAADGDGIGGPEKDVGVGRVPDGRMAWGSGYFHIWDPFAASKTTWHA